MTATRAQCGTQVDCAAMECRPKCGFIAVVSNLSDKPVTIDAFPVTLNAWIKTLGPVEAYETLNLTPSALWLPRDTLLRARFENRTLDLGSVGNFKTIVIGAEFPSLATEMGS